jgi:small subunit ribosomal protein S9
MSETPTAPVIEIAEEPEVKAAAEPKFGFWWGTGRRKSSVARVRIKPGDGQFSINKRPVDEYFTEVQDREDMNAALKTTKTFGKMDVFVNVHGGGHTGQAGAIVLGLARALKEYDPTLELILRKEGYLTVDARRVERKKYGQRGARRRFQFSKR